MRHLKTATAVCSAALMLANSTHAVAGMFDALIEKAVRGAAEQAVSGAVNQAAQPAQPAASAVPFLQNGCYVNFPPMPPSAASHLADVDRNGCIDYNEMSMYMQVYTVHTANAQAQPAAAPSGGGFFGALAGAAAQQAVSGRGAPSLGGLSGLTGKGAAFVAANQAIGAIGQAQQANPAAANAPAMANSQAMQVAMNSPQHAAGNDDLWEIVTKIEMPGMPMAIPPQTSRICAQAGKMRNEDKIPQNKNCSVLESRQSGDKYTFSMACEQNGSQMTGSGEVISSRDSYQGTVRSQTTAGAQAMSVTTNFSGKKVGNCTFGG